MIANAPTLRAEGTETRMIGLSARRAEVARGRVEAAWAALRDCRLCAHNCGIDRLRGQRGLCGAATEVRCFNAQTEVGDEWELGTVFAIALSGCDLRCDFCITGESSWNTRAGQIFDPVRVGSAARAALSHGAQSIMFLGGEPTIHLPSVLQLVAQLPEDARLVWKTNAHATPQARQLLDGLFNDWVADFKFGNDDCAQRLARVPNYLDVVTENLIWARDHTRLIVRHLLMPGHVDCCWKPVAVWLARNTPGTKVSLRAGFWPGWHSFRHPELGRTTNSAEQNAALQIAKEHGLNLIP